MEHTPMSESEARNRPRPNSKTALVPTDSQMVKWERDPEGFLNNWYDQQKTESVDYYSKARYLISKGYPVPTQDPTELAKKLREQDERKKRPQPPSIPV